MSAQMAPNSFKKPANNSQNQNTISKNNPPQGENSLETWKEIYNENNSSQLSKKSHSKNSSLQLPKQQRGAVIKKGGEMIMQNSMNSNQGYKSQGINIPNQKSNANARKEAYPQQSSQQQTMVNQNQQQQMVMYPNQGQKINTQQYQSLQAYPSNPNQQKPAISLSPKRIKNQLNPKKDMNPNQNQMNKVEMSPQGLTRVNSSGPHSSKRDFVDYNPYTLKDYKQLTRVSVVMGPLGANLGTKEWEVKKKKMKVMETYSNKISQSHFGLKSMKKDTPQDEIEKTIKRKTEQSIRYKTHEYSKLIHPKKVNNGIMDYYYKDLGIINEEEEKKVNALMESRANNNHKLNIDQNTKSEMSKERNEISLNNNIDLSKSALDIHNSLPINQTKGNQNTENIASLLNQQEAYKAKINDIKESLLN